MTSAENIPSRSWWQRVAAWVLVVLMSIAVAGSVIGFWVHRTVLDTDAFMASVSPIVESESVQAVVSDRVADQLIEALSLETRLGERLSQVEERLLTRLAEALDLPDAVVRRLQNADLGLDSLASVVAAGVETRIRDAVTRFISSPEGTRLLLATIETAHERSVLLLRDDLEQLPNVVITEGEVRLNLVPLIAEVLRSVVNSGLDIVGVEREIPAFDSAEDATAAVERLASLLNRDLPPDFGQVRLASEASLERAQGLVRAFDIALWVLIIAAVLLGALAVWMAPSVPSGLIRVGIAATIAAVLGWVAVQLIAAGVADAAATAEGRAAVGDIVSAVVNGLTGTALTLSLLGIGVVAIGVFAGRSAGPAVAVANAGPPPPPPPPAQDPAPPPVPAETAAPAAAATVAPARRRATNASSAASTPPKAAATTKAAATAKPATSAKAATPKATTKPAAAKATPKPAEASTKPKSTAPATKKRRRPPAAGA